MAEIKWDIKKDHESYTAVSDSRLKVWIKEGRIKPGQVVVWRSGLSGFRPPETLEELMSYFTCRRKPIHNHSCVGKRAIKTILVVDDELELSSFLSKFLASKGYEIKVALCGKDAIKECIEMTPDLIFLDENLPDTSGVQVLRKIKAMHTDVAVVMISAYGCEKLKEEAMELGAECFVDKPFSFATILKIIKGVSTGRKVEATRA